MSYRPYDQVEQVEEPQVEEPGTRVPGNGQVSLCGLGICPLVLGECVQGWLPDHGHFLITSPVDVFSRAKFVPDSCLDEVVVHPAARVKSRTAVSRYLANADLPGGGTLTVETPMEPGLGFGTSTADVTASIRAAANAWGQAVSPLTISQIALEIEPTDGSMYPGSVVYEYRRGVLIESLGFLPPFYALAVRVDDPVDTLAYDQYRKDYRYSEEDQEQLGRAWGLVRECVREQKLSLLGRAATLSARINEKLLPKPLFRELSDFVDGSESLGIIASHSGGVLGLVFDPARPGFADQVERAVRFVDRLNLPWFEISSGPMNYMSHWRRQLPSKAEGSGKKWKPRETRPEARARRTSPKHEPEQRSMDR